MLRLFPYNSKNFSQGQTATLQNAVKVRTSREINGSHTLGFEYPMTDEKAGMIEENMIVVCEGQAYRIIKICREYDGKNIMSVECSHVFNADSQRVHIQNIPDMIGVKPTDVLKKAFKNSPFTWFSQKELDALGMKSVDDNGFLIDFFSVDKTNPYDVMASVIKNCGKGEIYTDNYKIALVDKIGEDKGLRLTLGKNLENIRVERTTQDLITRLYPYGYEDAHIGSVNGGVQYIDSENVSLYGVREGYADYSDYKDPKKILNRALWEFSEQNPDRIDVPEINISGAFIDLSKLTVNEDEEMPGLGDTVYVSDGGKVYRERIIKIDSFPFEPQQTEISIGRVKKDLFFYLNQMGTLSRQYKKASAGGGKVSALAIAGNVRVDGISVDENGSRSFKGAVDAPYISLAGLTFTARDGAVYINDRKILLEEEVSDEAEV